MIERLIGHASRHGAVADDCSDSTLLAAGAKSGRHAEGRADGGARMADAEAIKGAFRALREGRQAVQLADGGQGRAAPGEDLVGISLMADIPHQPIKGRVEGIVQGEVSSTVPRLAAKCPPLSPMVSIR